MSSVNRTLCLSEYRIALSRIKIATDELRDARECFEKAKADILALMDDDGRPVIVDGDQAFLRVAGGSVVMQPCVNSYAVRGKPPELAELAGHGGVAYSDDDTAALVA